MNSEWAEYPWSTSPIYTGWVYTTEYYRWMNSEWAEYPWSTNPILGGNALLNMTFGFTFGEINGHDQNILSPHKVIFFLLKMLS